MPLHDIEYVLTKLGWMREQRIWPNGPRYLWTDAFGLVLLVSLYRDLHEERYLDDAEVLVRDVDRVLGGGVEFASVRLQTGTVSIFTIWRCGCTH